MRNDPDPVVEEVRKIREAYARQFNFDLRAMAVDLKRKEREHSALLVSFSPKSAPRR